MKISCIAVDDEPLALEQMNQFISRVPYLHQMASLKKGFDALAFLKENKTDLVFLDIHLEDISGIQILKNLRHKPIVILTTAYDQYALEGFDLDVCDYLLKPISFERFVRAVEKARDMKTEHNPPPAVVSAPVISPDFIFVKSGYRMKKILLRDILVIEGCKDYVIFRMDGKKDVISLLRFAKIETMLLPPRFVRIHKSFIAAIDKIDSIGKNAVTIREHSIPIGETYKEHFFKFLAENGMVR